MVCNATLSEPPGNLGGCRQPQELCSWGSAGPEKAHGAGDPAGLVQAGPCSVFYWWLQREAALGALKKKLQQDLR